MGGVPKAKLIFTTPHSTSLNGTSRDAEMRGTKCPIPALDIARGNIRIRWD